MATQMLHRSPGRDAATGLMSLLALVALVVAIPVLLVSFIGWPLPRAVPSIDEITAALGDRYVPDRFVVGALACVCWLIWVELVASVVVEAFAYARGEQAADVPLAGGMQKVVGRLIGGVALLIAAFVARGEDPAAIKPLVPAQPTPIAALLTTDVDPTADAIGSVEFEARPTYTVEPRDTLWAIAEHTLGDPFRWSEIWELNGDKDMGSGRLFRDPDLIMPGWELELPADALVPGAEPTAQPTVEPLPTDTDDAVDISDDGPPSEGGGRSGGFGGGGSLGSGSGGDSGGATLDSADAAGDVRVEVLEPLDGPEADGPSGGVIAGPRVETLDPIQPAGELAEDGDQVDETAGPVDESHD